MVRTAQQGLCLSSPLVSPHWASRASWAKGALVQKDEVSLHSEGGALGSPWVPPSAVWLDKRFHLVVKFSLLTWEMQC